IDTAVADPFTSTANVCVGSSNISINFGSAVGLTNLRFNNVAANLVGTVGSYDPSALPANGYSWTYDISSGTCAGSYTHLVTSDTAVADPFTSTTNVCVGASNITINFGSATGLTNLRFNNVAANIVGTVGSYDPSTLPANGYSWTYDITSGTCTGSYSHLVTIDTAVADPFAST